MPDIELEVVLHEDPDDPERQRVILACMLNGEQQNLADATDINLTLWGPGGGNPVTLPGELMGDGRISSPAGQWMAGTWGIMARFRWNEKKWYTDRADFTVA